MTKILKRMCRHCGAVLRDMTNECWYCHKTLVYEDIIRAEKDSIVNETHINSTDEPKIESEESKMNAEISLSSFAKEIFTGSIILIFGSLCIFIYQVYYWLKFGSWLELPLYYILNIFPASFADWIYSPKEWIGISNILRWVLNEISIAIFVFILGIIILVFADNIDEKK